MSMVFPPLTEKRKVEKRSKGSDAGSSWGGEGACFCRERCVDENVCLGLEVVSEIHAASFIKTFIAVYIVLISK